MQHLFELWVADAELLAPNRSHAIHGGIVEPIAKSVAADHSSRAQNDKTFLAGRWNAHRCCGRYLATRCHDTSRFSIRYRLVRKLASESAHQQSHCNRYVENSGNPFECCQYAGLSGKRHDIAVPDG